MAAEDKKKYPAAGHRQRLRDKFQLHGLDKFTEAEVLELLLTFGTPRRDCKPIARALLSKFGTLREVFEAAPADLASVRGAGSMNILAIKFIQAVAGKYLEQRLKGRSYCGCAKELSAYLRHEMENLPKELFKAVYMDQASRILDIVDVAQGTISSASVYPRELVELAIKLNSCCLVLVHNHPSGNVSPSEEDQRLTRHLVHLSSLVGMKMLDHIIIGKNGTFFSFREHGLMDIYEREARAFYRLSLPSAALTAQSEEGEGPPKAPPKGRSRPQ